MSKIRESARGVPCQARIPFVCSFNDAETVWAHCNGSAAGKGHGMKSHDLLGAYMCFQCHSLYDRRIPLPKGMCREDVEGFFADAHYRSLRLLIERGLVKC